MPRRRQIDDFDNDPLLPNDSEERDHSSNSVLTRNLVGFWLLGLCNNFAYVIMLSAAKDILESGHERPTNGTLGCKEIIVTRDCQPISTGSVLLADIIPSLLIKITAPMYLHTVPFGIRHLLTVLLQAGSFLLVATSSSVPVALAGVVLASLGSGLGEVSYLSLASYFNVKVISAWSSGTGGAGIFGALTYAVLTDSSLLAMSPRNALLSMLIVPLLFAYTYWFVLSIPNAVHRVSLPEIRTYIVPGHVCCHLQSSPSSRNLSEESDALERPLIEATRTLSQDSLLAPTSKPRTVIYLLRFMIPLVVVYFGEYFINQGLVELLEFDCSHGWGLSAADQYRWYQVLYQLGVFISRSSSDCILLPTFILPVLAVLQLCNAAFFVLDALHPFVSHISIIFCIVLFEGLLGGASYVNTFKSIHRQVHPSVREFSMGFVSISDTLGIVFSGFLAIPVHNIICSKHL